MEINKLINLELTQSSGQTSQSPWKCVDNSYENVILVDNIPILLKTSQNNINSFNLNWELATAIDKSVVNISKIEKGILKEIYNIYDLNFDLEKFYDYLMEDNLLVGAVDFCRGLRLFLARDPFECLVSSICSANNSIVRWTKSIDKIKLIWGDEFKFPSGTFYKFPIPEILMDAYNDNMEEYESEGRQLNPECYKNNLKSCGVGYRGNYIKAASEIFALEKNLNDIQNMTYEEAFNNIIKVSGVGPKVADCILLYGFGFKEAFPTDVWIKRIVSHLYFDGKDISADKIRQFGMEKFGDYAGYVQLYLFHYARKSGLMKKLSPKNK